MREASTDLLHRHGLHVTAQRLAVVSAVSAHPHATADDIAKAVRAEIGVISRQAVYDALTLLSDRGIIRRIQPAGSPARFEDRTGDNHHHLICRTCGFMVDVDCAVGAAPCLAPVDAAGFQVDEAEVVYWGRCPDCLAQTLSRRGTAEETVPAPRVPRTSDDSDAERATAPNQTERS